MIELPVCCVESVRFDKAIHALSDRLNIPSSHYRTARPEDVVCATIGCVSFSLMTAHTWTA